MATAFPLPLDTQPWRMPIERYHAMIRSGLLTADDHVELLEGVLIEKMSKNAAHRIATRRCADALRARVPGGWYVDEQAPITAGNSEPEPDACIVRGHTELYARHHPGPADVGLVLEVADSSLNRDRGIKKRIYASAGIPTYWLLDLAARTLEIYTQPQAGDYLHCEILSGTQHASATLDAVNLPPLPIQDLLPPEN